MEIYKFVINIISFLASIGIIFLMFSIFTKYNSIFKALNKKINFIDTLVNVIATQIYNPAIRELYTEMIKRGPDKIMTAEDEKIFLRERALNFYMAEKEKVMKWLEENNDPTLIEEHKQRFQEIESILNFMDTLDENTSPEQEKIVMDNIFASVRKLDEMKRDL